MRISCNSCGSKVDISKDSVSSLDLQPIPPVDLYTKSKEEAIEAECHPIGVFICPNCSLVQIKSSPPPSSFFEEYIYESSSSPDMKENFQSLVKRLADHKDLSIKNTKILDIGCNDGLLLSLIKKKYPNSELYGTDPSPVSKSASLISFNLFSEYFPGQETLANKPFDLILATNSFAHIPKIGEVIKSLESILKKDGLFILEVSDFEEMAKIGAWDYIYHEHIYYYTKLSISHLLNRAGFSVSEIEEIPTKGGSIRVFAEKFKESKVFNSRKNLKQELIQSKSLLDELKNSYSICMNSYEQITNAINCNAKLYGYGACATASVTIAQHELFSKLECLIDDNPKRTGLWAPASAVQVKSLDEINFKRNDIVIVFAWRFIGVIKKNIESYCETKNLPVPTIVNSMKPR